MIISPSAPVLRLLLCGVVAVLSGAAAQAPQATHGAPPAHKPPVVQPHGPVHALKPPLPKPEPAKPAPAPATTPTAPVEQPKPTEADNTKGAVTGLPTPRFVSLRSDEVYLRAGPGQRYPIEWVYKRRDLPVEILREFDVWRLVEDPDGIKGWMHQATLTGRRSFLVTGADATLRHDPHDDATPVAILKAGVIGELRSCPAGSDWCQVRAGDYRGYLKRNQFWGVLPGEVVGSG